MKNDFRGLIVGWAEAIYVKLKEVEKLVVRHFKKVVLVNLNKLSFNSKRKNTRKKYCEGVRPSRKSSFVNANFGRYNVPWLYCCQILS